MSYNHRTVGRDEIDLARQVLAATGTPFTETHGAGCTLVRFQAQGEEWIVESYQVLVDPDCDGEDVWESVCYPANARPRLLVRVLVDVWESDLSEDPAGEAEPDQDDDTFWESHCHYVDTATGTRLLEPGPDAWLGRTQITDAAGIWLEDHRDAW